MTKLRNWEAEAVCRNCGRKFVFYRNGSAVRIFCSTKCHHDWMKAGNHIRSTS